jgi:Ca2+-binding EF-hand superfamily protein
MLQTLGMDDADMRSAQVPALMAQMDPEGTGMVTLESFNGVAVGV